MENSEEKAEEKEYKICEIWGCVHTTRCQGKTKQEEEAFRI